MKKFLQYYKNPNEDRINHKLMKKEYDRPLTEYVADTFKSLEVLKYIKFLGYDYNPNEATIDFNEYIRTRERKKEPNRYKMLADSRYGEMILRFQLDCKGERAMIEKKLLLPKEDEDGFYTIKGKKYFLMYQLVDSSTYTTKNNPILKSLMPIPVKREAVEFKDINKTVYTAPLYKILIFKKDINILLFYFVKFGVAETLKYFSVDKIIKFRGSIRNEDRYIYFRINSKILIEVDKEFFMNHQYVQSIVFMLHSTVNNRLQISFLEDRRHWVEKIGGIFSTNQYNYYEKGSNTMTFFDRMFDETTKNALKLSDENKDSVYAVVRWMVQNFNDIIKKNNLDINNKRLRCNEFIASLLTKELSTKLNRIISLGKKTTLKSVQEIFSFSGDMLLTHLFKSNLLRFDDIVNDMNFWNFWKYTFLVRA